VTPVGDPGTDGGEITNENVVVAVTPNSSVTVIVNGNVPSAVAVPEIVPVAVSYIIPAGRVPDVIE
jgi:hypothetical protein